MDFKELKEKCFGRSVEEIKNIINEINNFWKSDTNLLKLTLDANNCANKILQLEKEFPALFVYRKECKILLCILKEVSNIELIPDNESFDDFDAFLKIALVEMNSQAYFLNMVINQIIEEARNGIINELYEIFNSKMPSVEDIEKLKDSMKNIFSDESPEKLEKIEGILAFNDPMTKTIKDIITDSSITLNKNRIENINKNVNTEKEENKEKNVENDKNNVMGTMDKISKTTGNITKKINEHPIVKELNDSIREQQMERIKEYTKELNDKINNN